ncbi:ribulose-phosphate 3-epimerase [Burkholderia ubonensis]|uniref:ribulose-phosphate 3-epimerase n=1 Tax=Burkholderia ubonensis TaxID=101571 RepID=UPI000756B86E|nr:ribulose-phosphate 3-epimerase [Burkholderia ubonensis]KVS39908.1 ribulose phosphate epimerase [Burkholderia ubonensis]KVS48003.1 ribulose phosphate epimerase [Burkholderia ubonensis]KVS78737.1 ribulose phosphate epimerase [Burkholderia ubonensis]KVS93462.1 ribulose phosphate epimerase [Burkholderia ubonensis]KVS94207.1 ribulose phosphate epimerase [Burkholderia ubonensis]
MSANVEWRRSCLISPSLITFDLCNLERQVELIEQAGIDVVHLDVIDGHFSPSMPIGIETLAQLRRKTHLAFDVHVMATQHDYFVDALLDIGVQQLTFQIESEPHVDRMLSRIRAKGARAGVALKPATSLCVLDFVLEKCDTVLLMLTNPGFAGNPGETQVPYADRKIAALRALIDQRHLATAIEIDGRVSKETIRKFAPGTVDIFVAGSACISRESPGPGLRELVALRRALLDEDATPV